MDRVRTLRRNQIILDLERAVADAAEFLAHAPEDLRDENQSARQVISHLVFWHGEYVRTAHALAQRRAPRLRTGAFRDLNAQATDLFARESLPALARQLARLNHQLIRTLAQIADWQIDFSVKTDVQFRPVTKRVPQITAHIRSHVQRLKQVERKYANA